MDATSHAAKNQLVVPEASRRNFLRSTAALAAAVTVTAIAVPAAPQPEPMAAMTGDQAYLKETLEHMCLMMEMLRAWHNSQDARLKGFDKRMNSELFTLIQEGVMSSRVVARAAGIEVPHDYINGRVWRTSAEQGVTA